MEATLLLTARDPLLLRDGRPFDAEAGAYARSLEWPLPRTIAGALRTAIGNDLGFDWAGDGPKRARRIRLRGALPLRQTTEGWAACVPGPADAVFACSDPNEQQHAIDLAMCLRPAKDDASDHVFEMPAGIRPIDVFKEFKPEKSPLFWTLDSAASWLSKATHDTFKPDGMNAPGLDVRAHVSIDAETGAAAEGMLFTTELRAFGELFRKSDGQAIMCRIECDEPWAPRAQFITLGGERRVACITPCHGGSAQWPEIHGQPDLLSALEGATRLRMQLATPALFDGGWRPGWLDASNCGCPPGSDGVRLRLVAAVVGRPAPVSGWRLDRSAPGPLSARLAAPAGSVYFFEAAGAVTGDWAARTFLAPVCDRKEDCDDGFGLALYGVWEE